MTAIRDRQSDPEADDVTVPWDLRPIAGARPGLPWWGAVLLGFGLSVVAAFGDMQLQNTLTLLFQACYFLGAVGAICAVQRRSLFGPMVQPPLILAITVPGVILFASGLPASSDTLQKALAVGTPLINGFPTMAVTTGVVLAVGFFRIYRERDPNAPVKVPASRRPASQSRPADKPAGRGAPAAARGGRPSERRAPQRRPGEPGATPPPGRRPRPEDGGGARKTPPPANRQRRPRPEDGERRRAAGEGVPGRVRRTPPRSDDPRAGGQGGSRRAPGRRTPPPRANRPWDNED
ncbi:DUF6542 domain-containing protein [Amycolatopsis anabasis]|uniref:DUF6542 domain-containing protein n=1 Tax=Amycolatopsis anabasis TaxID=1840409 RepID=UPI00131DEFBD|nr:DUF6542 domain-containing protein [Amycolatopsis anabasis]